MELIAGIFNSILALFWIILGFGGLIFIHELGHFLAAKWAGIRAEAFAVGMGPVMLAWRKGIGLTFGSSSEEYERRARAHLAGEKTSGETPDSADSADVRLEDIYRAGDQLGLGETEYSLRYLPIGGFVKMLGQEDANPNYVSSDPRSYNRCPIGKRMIVVSAGVIMNVLFAAILFVWAFMIGVRLEAPVIGAVGPSHPAGITMATNASALGVTEPGLKAGDRVLSIDGDPVYTFADISIASAMSRPDLPLTFTVQRDGVDQPLIFEFAPTLDKTSGMRSIGVTPGRSTTLMDEDKDGNIAAILAQAGLDEQGIRPSMRLLSAAGQSVSTFEQLSEIVVESDGDPMATQWVALDDEGEPTGQRIEATINIVPSMQQIRYPRLSDDNFRDFEMGLIGLAPLTRITQVLSSSHNAGVFQSGDVVLSIDGIEGPRQAEFRRVLQRNKGDDVPMDVLRDGKIVSVIATVNRKGMLGVMIGTAADLPVIATPFASRALPQVGTNDAEVVPTPVADLNLLPLTRIEAVGETDIASWRDLWIALRAQTAFAFEAGEGATVSLSTILPTPGADAEQLDLALSADDVRDLQGLTWSCDVLSGAFDSIYTIRSAEGSPLRALAMGVQETHKVMMITYLTIDRLVRRTVGVEQLRGPVGIIHIGVRIVDRGFIYMLFFFGMISVNLAVINFLPLPIVDGGLFLFLIYEKLKGKPPSIAFQNAATIVGLCLIGTIFLVTFYNDVMRLIT